MKNTPIINIVAFTGRKGHGKNTAADILKKNLTEVKEYKITMDFMEFAFADILKNIAADALKITLADAEDIKRIENVKIANGLTIREFYNTLGDTLKAKLGQNLWAKLTLNEIDTVIKNIQPKYIIITDLRYPIEEAYIRKYCEDNGYQLNIVKMINTNVSKRVEEILGQEHESESLIDEINPTFTIEAKSIKEIEIKMKEFLNEL